MAEREMRIRDLVPRQRVRMYGTVIEVTAPWYVTGDEHAIPGWGRLPMIWDGLALSPPEMGDDVVVLAGEQGDHEDLQRAARAGDAPGADGGGGDGLRLRGGGDRADRADDHPGDTPGAPPGPPAAAAGAAAALPRRIRGASTPGIIPDEASLAPGIPGDVIFVPAAARCCAPGFTCTASCASGPCSRLCQSCRRLAWSGTGVPCPACPDHGCPPRVTGRADPGAAGIVDNDPGPPRMPAVLARVAAVLRLGRKP
jgi:hypothetical protein